MSKRIVFYDCDETLWTSPDKDYISSVSSPFQKLELDSILRTKDNKPFTLKDGARQALNELSKNGVIIGIVSDNKRSPVIKALKLFRIWKYVNPKYVNIRLWKGYCPKHKMILEVVTRKEYSNMYWFDDKDYSKEAKEIGASFVKVNQKTNLLEVAQKILKSKG